MSIKNNISSAALIATDYPKLFDNDSNNSSNIKLFSKSIMPTILTNINNYKEIYNNITDDSGLLDEVESENFNEKQKYLSSEEYKKEENKQQIVSGYYNFHINANLVNGLVGGGGVSGSSNSNSRYNNVMNAGIFQNNGGLFFHQGQHNSMRSSLGASNSSLHGNVNILLGGAMLSVVITVLCVVCYCCHRNIKKRTESAYRQRWLENDPNMEIYSVEQCYETSGLFMDSDETLANQVPQLSHQPPPSYDAVVAMDEMINHRISPPPGYRSTTSITSNNGAIKYIDFQQIPSTSSSTATSTHHPHQRYHYHDLQSHNSQLTSHLQLPNHHRHRPSIAKCPSLRNYNHHRSFGNRQPGTYEKNYHFRMLRSESCCSLERALGTCRISALDSSSSSNGSILEDENISLPPTINSRFAINNSSTSSKLNTPSIPSTSIGSEYDHSCSLCGKFRNYSNCSNVNENVNKFNLKKSFVLSDKSLPEATAIKSTVNETCINNLFYSEGEQQLKDIALKINNSPTGSGSIETSSSSSSNNSSHTCECYSINSQQLPLSDNSTNLTSLTIPSTSITTSITEETNASYLTDTFKFLDPNQIMDTNQDNSNSDAPLVELLVVDNNNNNNYNNNNNNNNNNHNHNNINDNNNNINNILDNNNINNIIDNNNNIHVTNDSDNNSNNCNEHFQSSTESLQEPMNNYNCNNSDNNISNDNSNINETVISQAANLTTVCQNKMAASSVNGFNNNNNNNNNNNEDVTCSSSIDSIDSINDNGIIRLDMSQMIDKTGLPTYDAAIKLQSSGYV